jgi:rhomboid family GlyGly-CTERM serine protease
MRRIGIRDGATIAPMNKRLPHVTLAMLAGALLIASAPALRPLLIYDREQILAGELWRMFTGHWVHLSLRHLLLDVSAMALIGWLAETNNRARFAILCLFAPILISLSSLIFAPDMHRYYGLSALAMTAWTFLAFRNLITRKLRVLSSAMLTAAVAKILFELASANALFVPSHTPEIRVAVISHVAGTMIGALFAILPACVSQERRAKQVRSESPDYSRQV